MILKVLTIILLTAMMAIGCVDIPASGPAIPDYEVEMRILYLDLALPTATISIAPGPDFTTYADLPPGNYGTASPYITLSAGDKKLFVKGADPGPSSLSVDPDQRGTLFVFARPDTTTPRFVFLNERYTFGPGGILDSALVRFVNSLARRSSDTSNISLDLKRFSSGGSASANGIALGGTSSKIRVPKDTVMSFYLTLAGTTTVVSDTIVVTGASNKDYTIVAHDSINATTGKVRFVRFENN